MVVRVRPAHAGNHKAHWAGPDADPPLSPLGRPRAEHHLSTLDGIGPHTLSRSPTVGCRRILAAVTADRGPRRHRGRDGGNLAEADAGSRSRSCR